MLKKILAAAAVASLIAVPAAAQTKRTMLSIVTSGDAQTQLMAMVLTMQTAAKGLTPRILLCGPAGDIALRDAPESATKGQPPMNVSPQALMQKIMKDTGATVEVCAIYLPGRGDDKSVLIDGVGVASPPAMGALIADPETKVVSF